MSTLLLGLGCANLAAQPVNMTPQEKTNLQFVLDWWREGFVGGHKEAAGKYLAADMIQHNPNFPNGNAPVEQILSRRTPLNPVPATLPRQNAPAKAFAKGDFVVLIWNREAKDPADPAKTYKYNDFDLFRIENGKIREHWDGAMKNASEGSPGGKSYGQQSTVPPASASVGKLMPQEQKNQEIATKEMKDILQYGHIEVASEVMAPGYIQHNPNVPTGRDGFLKFFGPRAKPEPVRTDWKNKPALILTSGDLVFFMQERQDPAKTYKYNTFDLLRVDNGMIQEHWDAARKAPPAGR
jgi:predicted SnoaL-like aldol condensation-catalyzing enzyme